MSLNQHLMMCKDTNFNVDATKLCTKNQYNATTQEVNATTRLNHSSLSTFVLKLSPMTIVILPINFIAFVFYTRVPS